MRVLFALLFVLTLDPLHAQVDLSALSGTFVNCKRIPLLGLFSMHVRPSRFSCPKASGFVMKGTPVKELSIQAACGKKKPTLLSLRTSPGCNTVQCLEDPDKIRELVRPQGKDCAFQVQSMALFEYYPVFKSAGPRADDPFLESMTYNNEHDPDYLSRVNGAFPVENVGVIGSDEDRREEKNEKTVAIDASMKDKLCALPSLKALESSDLEQYFKLTLAMYQNSDYGDEKLQRKLFCLLKGHFEDTEDYDRLLDLIAKMKFGKEDCQGK